MKENDFILLEISGEYGNLEEYKKTLCEASLLGINKILFACIWDNNEKNGKIIFEKVKKICNILNIFPLDITIGYDSLMYDQAMIGKLREEKGKMTPDFVSIIPMNEYKILKGIPIDKEKVDQKLTKII